MQCRIRLSFEKRTYIYFCSNDIAHTSSLNHSYVEDAKNATSEKTMCVNDMQSEFISKVSAGVMTSAYRCTCVRSWAAPLDWTGLLASGTLFLPYSKCMREEAGGMNTPVYTKCCNRSSILGESKRSE